MADASAVDAALVAKLLADATLMAITTDGVYIDLAPQGCTKFVLVSQSAHEDAYTQPETSAFERFVYLVKAVTANVSGVDAKTAAARIHTLLQFGTLSATGYSLMTMRRLEDNGRVRHTEVDAASDRLHWQHRGGLYEIEVQPS